MDAHRALVACEVTGEVRTAFAKLYPNWEIWSADILAPDPDLGDIKPVRTYYPDPNKWHHFGDCGYGFHYQGDVRDLFDPYHFANSKRLLYQQLNVVLPLWDLIIAHPPCDHISYAGARWFKLKDARRGGDGRMQAGADFFMEMLNAPSPLVAVENPHSIIQEEQWAGPSTQVVEPWFFGDPYSKAIHLWLKGLPWLMADMKVDPTHRVATGGGSHRTDKAAGKTGMNRYEDSKGRKNRARMRSKTLPGFARAMSEQWGEFMKVYYGDGLG